jgi:signal transduction histidine kinase/CheY-like chemotaxis protein
MGSQHDPPRNEDVAPFGEPALEAAVDIAVLLSSDGRVEFINDHGSRVLGCDPDEILGQYWLGSFVSDLCMESLQKAGEKLLEDRDAGPQHFAGNIRTGRGTEERFLWRAVLHRNQQGEVRGLLCTGTRLPPEIPRRSELEKARRRLEEVTAELRATQRQVLDQEKHRTLTEMAGGLAHDFRNSLAVIHGFTDMLLHTAGILEDHEKTERYLKVVFRAAEKAADTVEHMRTFYHSCTEEQEVEEVSSAAVINKAVDRTRSRWQGQAQAQGIDIEVETDIGTVPAVRGVFGELREMLTCLLVNAVDALPEGGHIWVRTRRMGERVLFEVEDDGCGMSPEVRKRCLDPFYSTRQGEGAGLGLSVVQGVADRHGGEVEIETSPSGGTSVRVKLPTAEALEREEQGDPGAPLPQLRVLVVEDEALQRDMIKQFLQLDGHSVETAADGIEGRRMAATGSYDLVITNGVMPRASGKEVARAVRERYPETPVLLLTGVAAPDLDPASPPAPVDMILTKPLSLRRLRHALREVTR